jgi:iron(III) transport system ATP-binding protein
VLLLDEPLSNLDARLRTQMGDEFRSLQKRLGITTLYVTHDQDEAMALSDRIVVMRGGRILQIGSPTEIYQRPSSEAVASFLGSPNLLDATVTEIEAAPPDLSRFTVKGDGWQGVAYGNQPFARGQDVRVLVRPEDLRIAPKAGEGDAAWHGEVIASVFRGARRSLRLRTSAGELHFEVPALNEIRLGETVEVEAAKSSLWAIAPG